MPSPVASLACGGGWLDRRLLCGRELRRFHAAVREMRSLKLRAAASDCWFASSPIAVTVSPARMISIVSRRRQRLRRCRRRRLARERRGELDRLAQLLAAHTASSESGTLRSR